jgi:hypothetical protein
MDMHECEDCGQMCDCDCDDLAGPQPDDCRCECETLDADEWRDDIGGEG